MPNAHFWYPSVAFLSFISKLKSGSRFSLAVEVSYIPVDCFSDSRKNRSLEKLVKNFRGNGWIWKYYPNMTHVIQACAEEAFKKGYKIVGIQFYGECWSSKNANYMFRKKSKNCFNGVGMQNANYVYLLDGKTLRVSQSTLRLVYCYKTICCLMVMVVINKNNNDACGTCLKNAV